jgi:O-antigen/teichoic acid export membrane protein
LLELATQVVNVAAMIGLALVWRSVWVLVLSSVLATLVRTILSHTILPGPRNRFAWDPCRGCRSLFEFGRWIFVSTALTFLATQSDRLILGKLVSVAELGFYSIAASLAAVPLQIVQRLGGLVFFPVVATAMRQADHDPTSIRTNRTKPLAGHGATDGARCGHVAGAGAVDLSSELLSRGTCLPLISASGRG